MLPSIYKFGFYQTVQPPSTIIFCPVTYEDRSLDEVILIYLGEDMQDLDENDKDKSENRRASSIKQKPHTKNPVKYAHLAITQVPQVKKQIEDLSREIKTKIGKTVIASKNKEKVFSYMTSEDAPEDAEKIEQRYEDVLSRTKEHPYSAYLTLKNLIHNHPESPWIPQLFRAMAESAEDPEIVPLRDQEHELIKEYMKHVWADGAEEGEEKNIAMLAYDMSRRRDDGQTSHDEYSKFMAIISEGKIRNATDLMELIRFEAKETFLSKIGEGVSGKTYLVYSPDFKADMALKICPADIYSKVEAEILRALDHPGIVKIRYARDDVVKKDGKPVYAIMMEYVDGNTLKEIYARNPEGLGMMRSLEYSRKLLDAIKYLWKEGFRHRDIHPGNIKVDSKGNVVVLDFGIAAKDRYAAPKDNRRYGGKTDLFSWGLMTYKMLTGEHFLNEGDGTTMHAKTIARRKKNIWKRDGTLLQEYREKIDSRVPEQFRIPILLALEKIHSHDNVKVYSRVQRHLDMMAIDPKNKKMIEHELGYEISDDKYVKILEIAYGNDPDDPQIR